MECLQELGKDSSLPTRQKILLEEHEMRLRLALAKNLASALTKESDTSSQVQVEVW